MKHRAAETISRLSAVRSNKTKLINAITVIGIKIDVLRIAKIDQEQEVQKHYNDTTVQESN